MRDPRLQELLRCALPALCPLMSTWAACSSSVHWDGKSEPRFPRVCHRHIDGADSRELALKRLEQALDDADFFGFSEQVDASTLMALLDADGNNEISWLEWSHACAVWLADMGEAA